MFLWNDFFYFSHDAYFFFKKICLLVLFLKLKVFETLFQDNHLRVK